jgi:hypothetical protein
MFGAGVCRPQLARDLRGDTGQRGSGCRTNLASSLGHG